MLPTRTQHRIYDVIPRELDLDWREPRHGEPDATFTETVELTVREQRQDEPPRGAYPLIAVTFDPTTVNWTPGRRLPRYNRKEPVDGDDTIAYREYVGEEMFDQLNIIVAVADDEGDIPKSVVAKEIAREVYAALLLETEHLNDPLTFPDDDDYIWPVEVEETTGEGIVRLPSTESGQPIMRYAMQFNCRYTFTESRDVPAVDSIEYEYRTRHEDGSVEGDGYGEGPYGHGFYGDKWPLGTTDA